MFNGSASVDGGLANNTDSQQYGTVTKKKNLSQAGIDKIMYDILASDQGLAALGAGENSSGGFGSSSKTLMSQDLMAKLGGEIALVTAEDTTTTDMNNDKNDPLNRFFGEPQSMSETVICTELVRQGLFDKELYHGGHSHFLTLDARIVKGYQVWGKQVATKMRTSKSLTAFMLPIVQARYLQIVRGEKSFLGSLTIYLGQPICFLIGTFLSLGENHGRNKQSA